MQQNKKRQFGVVALGLFLIWGFFNALINGFLERIADTIIWDTYGLLWIYYAATGLIVLLTLLSLYVLITRKKWGLKVWYAFILIIVVTNLTTAVFGLRDIELFRSAIIESGDLGNIGPEESKAALSTAFLYGMFIVYFAFYALLAFYLYKIRDYFNSKKKLFPVSIKDYVKKFFTRYEKFCKKYLTLEKPPYLFFVIWLAGISKIVDSVSTSENGSEIFGDWLAIWPFAVVFGIVGGFFMYYVPGLVYHALMRLSGGKKGWRISANLSIFSMLPFMLTNIIFYIIFSLYLGNEYLFTEEINIVELIFFISILITTMYSIILGYRGAIIVKKTKPVRSIVFLLVIPLIFYLAFYGTAVAIGFYQGIKEGNNYEYLDEKEYDYEENFFDENYDLPA